MKSIAVNAVSVDWPAAVGTAPDPPEAADARACANAVLPAPVGPTTAIALTTFADLLAGMSAHLPWKRAAPLLQSGGRRFWPMSACPGRSLTVSRQQRTCNGSATRSTPSSALLAQFLKDAPEEGDAGRRAWNLRGQLRIGHHVPFHASDRLHERWISLCEFIDQRLGAPTDFERLR